MNFETDKAVLLAGSATALDQVANSLLQHPNVKVEIDGYTDTAGSSAHNLTLSQQRAEAVRTQLIAMGIASSRLTAKGDGDTNPIADNTTPEGKANNRRVEFVKTS